jgi:hypothetical protein
MRCLEGSGVPVLYIGRTVPKRYTILITYHDNVVRIRDNR